MEFISRDVIVKDKSRNKIQRRIYYYISSITSAVMEKFNIAIKGG